MAKESQAVSVAEAIDMLFKTKIKAKSEEIKKVWYDTSSYQKAKAAVEAEDNSIKITISDLEQPDDNTKSPCDTVAYTIHMFEGDIKKESKKKTDMAYDKTSCKKANVAVEDEKKSITITISGLKKAD